MSESSSQDKTEKATPKRQRQARERGEVPRSRELLTATIVAAGVLCLMAFGGHMANQAAAMLRGGLSFDPEMLNDPGQLPTAFGRMLVQALWMILPLLIAAMVATLAAPILLGGWNISVQALKPDFGRVNPVKGLGRLLSANALVELGKALLKFGLLGGIAAMFIYGSFTEFLQLSMEDPASGMAHGVDLVLRCFGWLFGGLLVIAFVDAPYQWLAHQKKMRMTRQEVREEMKESEGRPEVKSKIRQLQMQMSQRRMMEKVPTADVIVVNPTHYAVALQYSAGKMRAPKVVAKGADHMAFVIRELGKKHRIPVLSAPPLARALYRGTELDQEIPAGLYETVAQVLSYVYRLRQWRGGPAPQMPEIGDVPGGEPDA